MGYRSIHLDERSVTLLGKNSHILLSRKKKQGCISAITVGKDAQPYREKNLKQSKI